jgi:hypothetical protein
MEDIKPCLHITPGNNLHYKIVMTRWQQQLVESVLLAAGQKDVEMFKARHTSPLLLHRYSLLSADRLTWKNTEHQSISCDFYNTYTKYTFTHKY